jgi:hypothetical protein
MNSIEKNAIKVVAKLAPWLAPLPAAEFDWRGTSHEPRGECPLNTQLKGWIEHETRLPSIC